MSINGEFISYPAPDDLYSLPRTTFPILFKPGEKVVVKTDGKKMEGLVRNVERCAEMMEQTVEIVVTDLTVYRTPQKKESDMENNHIVTVIRSRETKSARIYVETAPNEFLMKDGTQVERQPGEEMPLYGTMPDEIFIPLLLAGREEYNR